MPQPTQNDVHVDAILTNISIAYIQDQSRFISSKVFPIVRVEKQSDKFYSYTKADWFRDEAARRGDSTESAGSGYGLTTDSYSADVYAFHKDVGDQVRNNADSPLNLDADATRFVTQRLLLRQEIQWVTDYFATSKWGTDKTGTTDFTKWDDFAASDPIEDIEAGKETILKNTGFMPNTLVLGYQVARKLKNHPDFVDRIKYTSSQTITPDMIGAMLDIEKVYVATAIKNTAVEGATAAYDFTHGKKALLAYVNPSPGLLAPSAGYTFAWEGVSGGLGQSVGVSRFRMDHLKADRVEGESAWDNKIIGSDLGYFFDAAVA